jgi:hypothetical protein
MAAIPTRQCKAFWTSISGTFSLKRPRYGHAAFDASPGGSLVLPDSDGIINWEPPTYDPQTGLFCVATDEIYSVFYRTEPNVGAQPKSCSSVATLTGTHAPWPAKL